jgi:hypothetical protein
MVKDDYSWIAKIIVVIFGFIVIFSIYLDGLDDKVGYGFGIRCKSHTWFDKDKYCQVECLGYDCNWSSNAIQTLVLKSHAQDKMDKENRQIRAKQQQEESDRRTACFNAGKDYSYNFTIFGNYNLSCKKVAYINDHLIDKTKQVEGGYIKGSYSGFLSSGYVEGHLYSYITEGVLATGQLIKHISYHLDCENNTEYTSDNSWHQIETVDTKQIEYFTESEFVMEYVNKCIKE